MKTQGTTVGVIGLGLIGCSLAIGLKKTGFAARVLGSDKREEHQQTHGEADQADGGHSARSARYRSRYWQNVSYVISSSTSSSGSPAMRPAAMAAATASNCPV